MEALVMLALSDRDGEYLPHGSIYQIQYVHRTMLDDAPVVKAVWRDIEEKIHRFATEHDVDLSTGEPKAATFTPEDLREAWEKHVRRIDGNPLEPLPMENVAAFVGYWVPDAKRGDGA